MRRILGMSICLCFFFSLCLGAMPQSASAELQENKVANIFLDTLFGLATGVLVGVAISAPQHHPHWRSNIGVGAALGAVAGLTFGLVTEGRSVWAPQALLTIDGEKTEVKVPSVVTTVYPSPTDKGQEVACGVQLVDVRF